MLIWHRRRHPAGWILYAVGVLLLVQTDGSLLTIVDYHRHLGPSLGPIAVLADLLWVPLLATLPIAVALFPDGRIPVRRDRVVLAVFVAAALITTAYFYAHVIGDLTGHRVRIDLSTGDPFDVDTPRGAVAGWYTAWGVLVVGGLLGAIASLLVKLRRVDGDTRQQLRWFIYGAVVTAVAVAPVVASAALDAPQDSLANQLPAFVLAVALAALPITVVVGVMKYRLYDLNIVVSRSIGYALVAAGITAAYLAVVALFSVTISADSRSLVISVLATLVAAATFHPLRLGGHRVANRIVYGKRATPYEALSAFADQLEGTPDLDSVLSRAAHLLADATGAQLITVWLRHRDDQLRAVTTWPPGHELGPLDRRTLLETPLTVTEFVSDDNDLLGGISVTKRSGDHITQTDRQLLHQLAAQAGLALRNSRLTADLRARLDDLSASRRRLVAAQDDARRRIERDLHDGAQQHLIVLNMKLGRLRKELDDAQLPAVKTVTQLQAEVDHAIEDIRALAHGIFPPLLVDSGLAAALRSQVREAPVAVHVDSALRERCDPQVEAAAYFCVMEALQNVYRHAAAAKVCVRLTRLGGRLRVEVTDDGRGFDPDTCASGSGLNNIRDRVESLGGRLAIDSLLGAGTSIVIELPAGLVEP